MSALLSPYLWIFLLLLGLVHPYEKGSETIRERMSWLLLNTFVLFFGLRGNVGIDHSNYQSFYQHLLEGDTKFYEPAFTAIALLLNTLHLPYQCFVFLCACIINLLLFRFLRQHDVNFPLALGIFWAMSGVINQVDFVRSTISMMLFVNALPYIVARNARRYYAIVGVAFLFHYSALLYFPLYFLLHKKLTRNAYASVILFLTLLATLHLPLLDLPFSMLGGDEDSVIGHYRQYVTRWSGLQLHFSFAVVERILTAIVIYKYYDRIMEQPNQRLLVNGFVLFYLFYTLTSNYAILATRLANLFVWCYWLLWPLLLNSIQNTRVRLSAYMAMFIYMTVRVWEISLLNGLKYNFCLT